MTLDHPNTKRESRDDRRLAIAAAARAIIIEKGLEGLRTRDIALRVGINVATLHYHVPSKEALIALVADSLHRDFRCTGAGRCRARRGRADAGRHRAGGPREAPGHHAAGAL